MSTDTIFAISTPPGLGGIGVIRISGPKAAELLTAITGRVPRPRQAVFCHFIDAHGQAIDSGIALFFPAPASFTGEAVAELQGHGGPVVQQMLCQRLADLGARQARPGEFSERAFLNDKLDLAQAEAIADLIASGTETAARAAQRSLEGAFSRQVQDVLAALVDVRVFVEATLDFPDEEIDFIGDSDVVERLDALRDNITRLQDNARQGRLLRDGITIAIAGQPNAGKSSLLNALSGYDAAIVTEMPGTTRDVLRETISLDGLPVHVADTAGIRESSDVVEAEGVRRARKALQQADLVLLVIDLTEPLDAQLALRSEVPTGTACLPVFNKTDLADMATAGIERPPGSVALSAKTGAGLDELVQTIREQAGQNPSGEGTFSARQRHLDALRRTRDHVETGRRQLLEFNAPEVLAEELRLAQKALGEITGEFLPDDLLGAIFAQFCIGK